MSHQGINRIAECCGENLDLDFDVDLDLDVDHPLDGTQSHVFRL